MVLTMLIHIADLVCSDRVKKGATVVLLVLKTTTFLQIQKNVNYVLMANSQLLDPLVYLLVLSHLLVRIAIMKNQWHHVQMMNALSLINGCKAEEPRFVDNRKCIFLIMERVFKKHVLLANLAISLQFQVPIFKRVSTVERGHLYLNIIVKRRLVKIALEVKLRLDL